MQSNNNHSHSHLSSFFFAKNAVDVLLKVGSVGKVINPRHAPSVSDAMLPRGEPHHYDIIRLIYAQPEIITTRYVLQVWAKYDLCHSDACFIT
ncbi:hypothetical protein DK762_03775 [Salmonella enterica subsp. houtenae]|nr:hypothetical protein [Salmonella enterica subsp. houtenae]ECI3705970.1 hypothetical protein [Salmonella enterica subsp. houtenae]MLR83625.1 hypothetical protein [Salmonella enterica subsp. houtenae]